MCGISGFNWNDSFLIKKMNDAQNHRGPDGNQTYVDDDVSLGHVRLSIIDLSNAGQQPMANENKNLWIVFNGEIYNFSELRIELKKKGHHFKSKTDTETILHAYEEWGEECVERFNGMWAFAIYDKNKNDIFLSRDRFGIKSIYYYFHEGNFAFSSEIKPLLKHNIARIPNDRAIYEYLTFGLIDHIHETFFKGIFRVMPGENMVFNISKKALKKSKWYDLEKRIKKIKQIPEENVVGRIRNLFNEAVDSHLVSDVPVGSCLSGGIDSSSLVCTMKQFGKTNKIKTFSLVFPGKDIDESTYIDEVVKKTNVLSFRESPTTKDLASELADLIHTQEEPFGSLSMYGQYKVMQLAHNKNMKVLLDGQGADELFGGYAGYYRYYLFDCLTDRKFGSFLKSAGKDKKFALFLGASILGKFASMQTIFGMFHQKKMGFLNDFYDGETSDVIGRGQHLNQILLSDITTYNLPQLLRYEDKNSMRWSIESRVPFLDYRLVEFVASLPSTYKIHEGITKYAFRKAMTGVVPKRILGRTDKIGFATPDGDWLRTPKIAEFIRKLIDSKEFGSRKYWKPVEVKKLFDEHVSGISGTGVSLWRIINVELWLRVFMV